MAIVPPGYIPFGLTISFVWADIEFVCGSNLEPDLSLAINEEAANQADDAVMNLRLSILIFKILLLFKQNTYFCTLQFGAQRKDAGVVELARLESVCTCKGTVGSNPTLSANVFCIKSIANFVPIFRIILS